MARQYYTNTTGGETATQQPSPSGSNSGRRYYSNEPPKETTPEPVSLSPAEILSGATVKNDNIDSTKAKYNQQNNNVFNQLQYSQRDLRDQANKIIAGTAGGADIPMANRIADYLASIPVQSTENFLPANMEEVSNAYQSVLDSMMGSKPADIPMQSTDNFLPTNMAERTEAYQNVIDDEDRVAAPSKVVVPGTDVDMGSVVDIRSQLADTKNKIQDLDLAIAEYAMAGWSTTDLEAQRTALIAKRDSLNGTLSGYTSALQPEYDRISQSITDLTVQMMGASNAAEKERLYSQIEALNQQQEEMMKGLGIEVKPVVEWAGRSEKLAEYKRLTKRFYTVGLSDADREKRDRLHEELVNGDIAAGNGERSYTFIDRALDVGAGAAQNVGSSFVNLFGTMADVQTRAGTKGTLLNPNLTEEEREQVNAFFSETNEKWNEVYSIADQLGYDATESLDRAKRGLSEAGKAGVDIGENLIEMGFDAATAAMTGGGSALPTMFMRVFGSSAQEARQSGASLNQQIGYGLTKAGIEVATEKMFDGVAKIYGAGAADEITEKLIGKLASSDTGRTLLRLIIGSQGEGVEEVVSDLLDPLAKSIYSDKSVSELYSEVDPSDVLYSYLIGAAVGVIGGGTNIVTGGNAAANYQLRQNEAGIGVDANTDNANRQTNTTTEAPAQQTPTVEQPTAPTVTNSVTGVSDTLLDILQNSRNAETGQITQAGIQAIQNNPALLALFNETAGTNVTEQKSGVNRDAIRSNADAVINSLTGVDNNVETTAPAVNTTVEEATPTVNDESIEETPIAEETAVEEPAMPEAPATVEETTPEVAESVEPSSWQETNIENEANGIRRERGESRNIRTDAARAQELRDFKEQNPDMYRTLRNEKVFDRAFDIFDEQGTEGAAVTLENAIREAQEGKKLPIEMVVLHKLVCDDLARNGQVERANRISSDIAAELTYAGRLGQANVILRDSSPIARAEAFRKTLERLIGENNAEVNAEAIEDLVDRYRAAETDEARDAIIDEAMTAIAESSPTTFREAITAIRYLNMLGNFKTQIRNVLGNLGMLGMSRVKNRVLAVEQKAANAISNMLGKGDTVEQTSTLTTDRDLRKEALEYFKEDRDATLGEGKYSDVAVKNKAIQDKKTIFKWNWNGESDSTIRKIADAPMQVLEKYRKLTNWAMDAGDAIFTRATYTQALADYAKAQGYKSLADIDADTLQKMRDYAIKQAQEATFRDTNKISEFASTFDQNWGKGAKTIAQGVIPFRKTPANVGVRMWEYSPLGLVDTAADAFKAAKGNGDVNTVLDDLAKSLSGSALTALGFMMAKAGLARGKNKDEKLEAYEKNVKGLSDYSLTLPDGTSISLDWFAPESAAFFVGVAAADAFDDGLQSEDFLTLLGSTSDIALNMSFLSGLQNSLDSLSSFNGKMDALPSFLLNSLISYGGQIVTNSMLGQAEQASQQYRQTSYADSEDILPTDLQYSISRLTGKIPGIDYNQADYIDAWGRKQDTGDVGVRIFESFFSPAYINESRATEIDGELERLYEATGGSVLPSVASRSTEIDGKKLSPEEYETYQTERGQTALKLITDFINGDGYADMTDEQRADVIKDLYKYANDEAKNAVLSSRGMETETNKSFTKANDIMSAGDLSWAEYYNLEEKRDMDGNGSTAQEETAQYLFENFPEDKAKKIYDTYYPDSKTPYEDYASHSQEIKDSGFTREEYETLTSDVKEAKKDAAEWDSKGDNAVIDAVLGAVGKGLSEDSAALIIKENTSKNYTNPFSALIDAGHSLTETMDILDNIDRPNKDGSPGNKSIEQTELIAYFKEHPEEEALIALIWDAMEYTGKKTATWETFSANGYKTR